MANFETKDSGARAEFESGMQRDTEEGKARFDLLIPKDVPYDEQLVTRVAELMSRGAAKYTERNWEKANSNKELARYESSAYRHFMQWLTGETDEDHASAVVFNLIAAETVKYKMKAGRSTGPHLHFPPVVGQSVQSIVINNPGTPSGDAAVAAVERRMLNGG